MPQKKTFEEFIAETIRLDEAFENLGQLNAGPLMNVIKSSNRIGHVANLSSNSAIGAKSQVKDLGAIKSWKDLRYVAKKNDDYSGFALYANGHCFMMIIATGEDLSSINNFVTIGRSTNTLPAEVRDIIERERGWQAVRPSNDGTPARIMVRGLETLIDDVAADLAAHDVKITAKAITTDPQAREVAVQRYKSGYDIADRLQQRADTAGKRAPENALTVDLNRYKSSKMEDKSQEWASDPQKALMFVINNADSKIQFGYGGNLYTPTFRAASSISSIDAESAFFLGRGTRIFIIANQVGGYKSLFLTVKVDPVTMTIKATKVS